MDKNKELRLLSSLKERVKELECLYRISQLEVEMEEEDLDYLLQEIVRVLPPAWQYPEITCALINLNGKEYSSGKCNEIISRQESSIIINKVVKGKLIIAYTKARKDEDEGPFLKEERNLLNAVALKISSIIARTEQKRDKEILESKLRHADRLSTIGELTAGIAHELNEPLGTILGFAQLIEKEKLDDSIRGDLKKIIDAALHARNVIRKLIAFAKFDKSKDNALCNINEVIDKELYFLESRCDKENIKIVKILDESLPELVFDKTQFHQVIINLCVNAIQAMPEGGEILLQTKKDKDYAIIIVQDSGEGISDSNLNKIFDPFYSTKESANNSGLGLSVVYGIIESYKGLIEVESKINLGTRFKISLPINNINS